MAVHARLPAVDDGNLYESAPWVLLVGRDWSGREKARRTLEEAGCAVEVASTAEEALFCLKGEGEVFLRGARAIGLEAKVGPVAITNGRFGNRPHCI